MRLNGMTVVVTLAVSVLSLVLAIVVFSHKLTATEDSTLVATEAVACCDFLYDLLMGVFSSAVLTCATCSVGYLVERRHTLENFHHRTLVILEHLRPYRPDWDM